ncbi:MAG: adenylate/guanylate cyclase domain-containing protein [Natronospirillum sp.]|uniref:adenylate/guanylate cyclase domain-containing protein n=1 Tax=Natronospirillum sp. TaxID=2812955 RepID=UPI0025DB92AA|nr:adenylate/guanylate cyclase domain-containing protein [Natronospirillum sp.]MCH8551448.1 adenylate/guanylate cyclase domain-containing protein [Natronospirillum sp.]
MITRNCAVMFTDIKGFTSRSSETTRKGFRSLLEEHDRLLRPVFGYFGGVVVKTIGDAFLVRFDSPTDAVVCGLALQAVLKQHNAAQPSTEQIAVRVAINTGDVGLQDGDVIGEPVNVAARLEAIAEPGEVWFTEAVFLTMNRREVPTTEIGERTFKGIPRPVRVFKVLSDPPNEQIRQIDQAVRLERGIPKFEGLRESVNRPWNWRPWAAAALVAVLLGPVTTVVGYQLWSERQAVQRIERLLALGDTAPALHHLDDLLAERAHEPDVRALGLEVARRHLGHLHDRGEDPANIRDWLAERMASHSHLEPLMPEFISLHSQVELQAAFDSGRGNVFWQTFRDLLERYPDDESIPLIAANIQQEGHQIAETRLWPYQVLVERSGFPAEADALHDEILAVVDTTLDRNLPSSGHALRAHDLLQSAPPEARRRWADQALESGTGPALANSLEILSAENDPRFEEPTYRAIHGLLRFDDPMTQMATLQADNDRARALRVLDILDHARLDMAADLNQKERERAEELKTRLTRRWNAD